MTPSEAFLVALARVRSGEMGHHHTPSQTNYIVDPTDNTLWDLKPVLGLTLQLIGGGVQLGDPNRLVSNCREKGIIFDRVVFRTRRSRPLGLRANDSELPTVDWSELENERAADDKNASFYLVKGYHRNPKVVAEALAKADGVCQACKMDAPFTSLKGEPFLEVHHIRPLSSGGPDVIENVVALCPNCHRKQHVGVPDSFE